MLAWTSGIAFVGGVLGSDAFAVLCTSLAAFVQAYAFRRAPWRLAVIAITAWALGTGVGALLALLGSGASAGPSAPGAGVIVLSAYASALAGALLRWTAVRLVRPAEVDRGA
jgi:hypothetical protein